MSIVTLAKMLDHIQVQSSIVMTIWW